MKVDWTWAEGALAYTPWARSIVIAAAALIGGWLVSWVILSTIRRWGRRSDTALEPLLNHHLRAPLRVLGPLVALLVALPVIELPPHTSAVVRQLVSIAGVV